MTKLKCMHGNFHEKLLTILLQKHHNKKRKNYCLLNETYFKFIAHPITYDAPQPPRTDTLPQPVELTKKLDHRPLRN